MNPLRRAILKEYKRQQVRPSNALEIGHFSEVARNIDASRKQIVEELNAMSRVGLLSKSKFGDDAYVLTKSGFAGFAKV